MTEMRLQPEALVEPPIVVTLPPPVDSPVETPAATRRKDLEAQLPSLLLRAGLAFVLSYAATSSFFHPETFARYFPSFMPEGWATELLPVFAVFEMVLAAALMTERYTAAASRLAGIAMVAIIVANPDAFDVLFRNVAIACGAFALAVRSRAERAEADDRSCSNKEAMQ
jgi:uncharacterized membrane protein YphA (DoxX/SURF4 family)